jgi:predicted dehydrogenase
LAKPVGIGILGGGFAGRVHALAARTLGARLVGVVSSTPERSEEAAARFGAERTFTTAAELVDDPAVEVVHVCTPNVSHVPLVELALRRGKHVICEKPLATSVADAARLVALAEQSGAVAAVCFAYRYQPVAQEARARIHSGQVGPVHLIHGSYLQDWLLYETDGNWRALAKLGGPSRAFADIGSHWCDLAEWMTGKRITDVAAVTSTVHDKRPQPVLAGHGAPVPGGDLVPVDTEDAVCLIFRATGNVVGTLTVSQVSPGRKNRLWLEVDAAGSSIVFDQESAEWLWLGARDANRLIARDGSGSLDRFPAASALPAGHARGFVEGFTELFADVYGAVRNGAGGSFPSFEDGLRSAVITDAVLRSASNRGWEEVR